MDFRLLKSFTFFLLIFSSGYLCGEPAEIVIQGASGLNTPLGNQLYFLEDKSNKLQLKDILQRENEFKKGTSAVPNFGVTTSTIWCRFDVVNKNKTPYFVNFAYPCTDTVILYYSEGSVYKEHRSGWFYPLRSRAVLTNNLVFPLYGSEKDTSRRYYLKIRGSIIVMPVSIGTAEDIAKDFRINAAYFIFFMGLIFMLFIYNLAIYFTSRVTEYLYYSIWVMCSMIFFTNLKGYACLILPPSLNNLLIHINMVVALGGICIMLFVISTLRLKRLLPWIIKWFRIFIIICIVVVLCSAFRWFFAAYNLIMINLLISVIFGLISGISVYRKGYNFAKYYMYGFGITLITMWIFILIFLHIFEWNDFTSNAVLAGNGLEMILFSFGLGEKIKTINKEKHDAQVLAYNTLKEKEQLISKQNIILAEKVKERTLQLEIEKQKSDELLLNILPEEVAEELKINGSAEARLFDHVTVLFSDFVDFTHISEQLSPKELVGEIHHHFTRFDEIMEKHGLEKIKTIGDAYMAVAGLPLPLEDHARAAANAALEMISYLKKENGKFRVRIGLNSGPVVAGIVGIKKYAYDVWGDTVNTAARMEQNSEAQKINISGSTYLLLKNKFHCIPRGKIPAKNKGDIEMYFLEKPLE